jgi:hypothetical protein
LVQWVRRSRQHCKDQPGNPSNFVILFARQRPCREIRIRTAPQGNRDEPYPLLVFPLRQHVLAERYRFSCQLTAPLFQGWSYDTQDDTQEPVSFHVPTALFHCCNACPGRLRGLAGSTHGCACDGRRCRSVLLQSAPQQVCGKQERRTSVRQPDVYAREHFCRFRFTIGAKIVGCPSAGQRPLCQLPHAC